jgi:hypothetical protein
MGAEAKRCWAAHGSSIKHVDDVNENEVVRIEFEDGHSASIRERFMELTPNFVSFYNRWDPRMIARRMGVIATMASPC